MGSQNSRTGLSCYSAMSRSLQRIRMQKSLLRNEKIVLSIIISGFAVVSCAYAGTDYQFRAAEMTDVTVRSGFWLPRIETNRLVTIKSDFKRSEETGRIHR